MSVAFLAWMIAAVTLGQSSPVADSAKGKVPDIRIGEFLIGENSQRKTCNAVTSFGDNFFFVEYDAVKKSVHLAFSNKDATSLQTGDERQIKLDFERKGAIDDGWGELKFSTFIDDTGLRSLISDGLQSAPLLEDFAKSDYIAFFYNEKILAAFPLKQSAKVTEALHVCSMNIAGLNPNDPFAQ
jgi:hypothetical protein